jgi:hypothetical protein
MHPINAAGSPIFDRAAKSWSSSERGSGVGKIYRNVERRIFPKSTQTRALGLGARLESVGMIGVFIRPKFRLQFAGFFPCAHF